MRYLQIIFCSLTLATILCSPGTDIAVTQTGNPTQVSLLITADSTPTTVVPVAKRTAAAITLTSASVVIHRVEMEPVEGTEFILFQNSVPYVVELASNSSTGILDSTNVVGSNRYESFEMEFGPLEAGNATGPLPDTSVRTNSIVVQGYVGGNPQDTFIYTSNIKGSFEFEFDSAIVLPNPAGISVLVKIKIQEWFTDSIGGTLDPRNPGNNAIIENNILHSVSGKEQEGEYENSDEQ